MAKTSSSKQFSVPNASIYKNIGRMYDAVLSITDIIGILIVLLLTGFIAVIIFARYVLRTNIVGLFDLSVYMLIVFPFLTAAYTLRHEGHIGVDILVKHLNKQARTGLDIAGYLLGFFFVIALGWNAAVWAHQAFVFNQQTNSALPIPQWILIAVLTFGCFLLSLEIIRILIIKVHYLYEAGLSRQANGDAAIFFLILILAIVAGMALYLHISPLIGIFVILFCLLFSGLPVFLALGFTGCVGLYLIGGPQILMQSPIKVYGILNEFTQTSIPLFVLGGLILERGRIIGQAFKFFELFVGHFAPSMLIATVLTGALFCAITGSSVAATAVMTTIAAPMLLDRGYKASLVGGLIGATTLGTLIPPSLACILYGVLTGESVGELFMAAVVPAAIVYGSYIIYITAVSIINKKWLFENEQLMTTHEADGKTLSREQKLSIVKNASFAFIAPLVVLGGIYLGVFTPTEAAAVLVIYGIIVCMLIFKTAKLKDLFDGAKKSTEFTSMILCLIVGGFIFGLVISQLRIDQMIIEFVKAHRFGQGSLIFMMFIVLNVMGMFMPVTTIMVITIPIFYPLALSLNISPVWLGVFYIICGELGMLTPPVGGCLFTVAGLSKMPLSTVIRGSLPFFAIIAVGTLIISIWPELVLWLPNHMNR